MQVILFCLGLALGSFLHVVAFRYDPERFILAPASGRSHCGACKKDLAWYELVPLISFVIQRGHCRTCGARLGWSYFVVELLSGLIVLFAPWQWAIVFLVLLLMTLIDLRLQIIPDELIVVLVAVALGMIAWTGSVLVLADHFISAMGAALFFGFLIFITRGRGPDGEAGMGMGDAKLAFALGLLFGWPQTLIVVMFAFILGALAGLALILFRGRNMKSVIPFGPFLALGSVIMFFWGPAIIQNWYNLIV